MPGATSLLQNPGSPYTPQQAVNTVKQGYNSGLSSLQTGYNSALASAGNALTASQNTTSGENMQLGNTLQQQQSGISQNLANRGLGNTTVAATAAQAPMQAYNTAMANVANQGAIRTMSADQNIAGLQAQSGQAYANNQQQGGQAQGNIMNQYAMQNQQNQMNLYNQSLANAQANSNGAAMGLANGVSQMNAPSPQMNSQGNGFFGGQQYLGQGQAGSTAGSMLTADSPMIGFGQSDPNAAPAANSQNAAYQAQIAQMAQQPSDDDDDDED